MNHNDNGCVSAVMPVYNASEFLARVLDSILPQVDELIIVNDCSTDNSVEIVRRYQKKHKRLRLVQNKENCGPGRSINRGIAQATHEFIFDADADEVIPENTIRRVAAELSTMPQDVVGITFGRETPCASPAQKLMHLLRGRVNRLPDVAWIIDGPILYRTRIFKEGMRYGDTRTAERKPLLKTFRKRGLKVIHSGISVLHLGEPKSFKDLLKRQWHYGGAAFLKEQVLRKRHWIQAVFFLSPFGIFGCIPLYVQLLMYEGRLRRDPAFIASLPFVFWAFMFTYYLSFVKQAISNSQRNI